jgi:glycosyltransferase involved in cell wall biosynthesis
VFAALARLLADPDLRELLGRRGEDTAKNYTWERRIDSLVQFLENVARPSHMKAGGDTVPEAQRLAG